MFLNISNKLKEQRDEKQVKKMCENLNTKIGEILGFNPQFKYYGNKKDEQFRFYNESNNFRSDLRTSFSIKYTKQMWLMTDKEFKCNINDKKLNAKLYNRSYLVVAQIDWFSVDPTGKGIGSKIVKILIDEIKLIKTIEKIVLVHNGELSKKFWVKNGFREIDKNKLHDNRIYSYMLDNEMVLDILKK